MSNGKEEKIEVSAPELKGKYELIEEIDRGGYATVFKAIDLKCITSGSFVAIKRVQSTNIKPLHTNHLCIEAKILKEFRAHPYFPTIRHVLIDPSSGSYSIVMDYFQHEPFCEYNKTLNEQQTIHYMHVLLRCVAALSQKGYIHRDIKPSNFLYNPSTQKCMLIDFGLCQLQSSISCKYEREKKLIQAQKPKNKHVSHRLSKSKRNLCTNRRNHVYSDNMHKKAPIKVQVIRDGTPGFRAPEIILASNYQDSRIDVFNVGLILACIMFGMNAIFTPQNDYQQLVQFVNIYGLQKVEKTAKALNRNVELRGLNRESIFMNNGAKSLNSQMVSGYEDIVKNKSRFSYWVKEKKTKENVNDKCHRDWSEDLYDLLDKLTEFDPFERVTPLQALQHKIFSGSRLQRS